MTVRVQRLTRSDRELARAVFRTMAEVFDEEHQRLPDAHLDRLLGRDEFWAFAALEGEEILGGITAHVLYRTATESAEAFVYDIAIVPGRQRQGIGRLLVAAVRNLARSVGIGEVVIPAASDDTQAVEFYEALSGEPEAVTYFTFTSGTESSADGGEK